MKVLLVLAARVDVLLLLIGVVEQSRRRQLKQPEGSPSLVQRRCIVDEDRINEDSSQSSSKSFVAARTVVVDWVIILRVLRSIK